MVDVAGSWRGHCRAPSGLVVGLGDQAGQGFDPNTFLKLLKQLLGPRAVVLLGNCG